MGKKVFISHATADHQLVSILLTFLNDVGISNDDIFCTSISGTLEGGSSFVKQIKDNVKGSKIVIFLLSERFFLSYFCLAELGAAWALNRNILPIIVPPISIEEYNSTPLIGIQALSVNSVNFPKDFYNDLARKGAVERDDSIATNALFNDLVLKIKKETNILRKDINEFYVARLTENQIRQFNKPLNQPALDRFLIGNRFLTQNEELWKLNGILDTEVNSNITEHWISVRGVRLSSTKLKFKIGEVLEEINHQKLFALECFYELPL